MSEHAPEHTERPEPEQATKSPDELSEQELDQVSGGAQGVGTARDIARVGRGLVVETTLPEMD